MKPTDARRLKRDELTDLRRRGVQAVQNGKPPLVVARVLGVGISPVSGRLSRYRRGGLDPLGARKRSGWPPKLDAVKLKWLYEQITMNDPRQLQFDVALWSSRMIMAVIKRQFGMSPSKSSVCRLLKQLGLSPQKPLWRACQKDPENVQKWLDEDYPRIRKEARKRKARIFFADEAGVRSDYHAGTAWAPMGQTPVVQSTGARFGLKIISAVSPRGDMRFMTVHGTVNADVFIEFFKRLLHNASHPVFLIVGGHPSPRAKRVSLFVNSTGGPSPVVLSPRLLARTQPR